MASRGRLGSSGCSNGWPSASTRAAAFVRLVRPPPTSTLFPYTTLFRSSLAGLTTLLGGGLRGGRFLFHGDLDEDRKSTRLNSSHMSTSYAVFCLKKKSGRCCATGWR